MPNRKSEINLSNILPIFLIYSNSRKDKKMKISKGLISHYR